MNEMDMSMQQLSGVASVAQGNGFIKPTIGRTVLYWPLNGQRSYQHSQPFIAFITHVWSEGMINIAGFNDKGEHFARTSVPLAQGRDAMDGECGWMPYQVGQAQRSQA